jgi:hypothetical protein
MGRKVPETALSGPFYWCLNRFAAAQHHDDCVVSATVSTNLGANSSFHET